MLIPNPGTDPGYAHPLATLTWPASQPDPDFVRHPTFDRAGSMRVGRDHFARPILHRRQRFGQLFVGRLSASDESAIARDIRMHRRMPQTIVLSV